MAVALVQKATNNGTATANLPIGSGTSTAWATPTAGNLLVFWINADATATGPAGWTAGPSVVDGNGAYCWWKVAAGTETTIVPTHAAARCNVGALEYSGLTSTPFDVQNFSSAAPSTTSTASVSVTTTNAIGGVIVHMGLIHGFATAPTGPSWTNSFVQQQFITTAGASGTAVASMIADRIVTSNAAYATVASWTNASGDRQALMLSFKAAAAGAASLAIPPRGDNGLTLRPRRRRAA